MNAKQYKLKHGVAVCRAVAQKAGTNYVYFYQLASGFRTPSTKMARRLIASSRQLTPNAAMTAARMLPDVWGSKALA